MAKKIKTYAGSPRGGKSTTGEGSRRYSAMAASKGPKKTANKAMANNIKGHRKATSKTANKINQRVTAAKRKASRKRK